MSSTVWRLPSDCLYVIPENKKTARRGARRFFVRYACGCDYLSSSIFWDSVEVPASTLAM